MTDDKRQEGQGPTRQDQTDKAHQANADHRPTRDNTDGDSVNAPTSAAKQESKLGFERRKSIAALTVVVISAVVAGIGYFVFSAGQEEDTARTGRVEQPLIAPVATRNTPAVTEDTPSVTADTLSVTEDALEASKSIRVEKNELVETGGPTFDVVRVDPSGELVIAGRAEPNSSVTLNVGGKDVVEAPTTPTGEFVVVPETALAPGTHTLSLRSKVQGSDDVKSSENNVIVVVPERETATSIAIKVQDEGPATVLRGPDVPAGLELTLTQIDYDESGRATYQGTGRTQATIRLYLDNAFITETRVNDSRRWGTSPENPVSVGTHELRLDQVSDAGDVEARIVISFVREGKIIKDAALPAVGREPSRVQLLSGFVTVRRGQSLWRIARSVYGHGTQYTVIYESNQDQIRDPDLIYPGQIFTLPTARN